MKPAFVLPAIRPAHPKPWIPLVLAGLMVLPASAASQCPLGATVTGANPMALRFNAGDSRRTLMTSDQTTTQTIMGQQQSMHQVTKMGVRYEVMAPGPDGRRRVRVTYESMSFDATTPMGRFSWSSSDTTGTVPQGAEIFAALVNHGYTVDMDADGSNRHVEGWDSLADRLMAAMPAPPGSSADDVRTMLKKNVEESIIGGTMRDALVMMPSQAPAIGASWSCTSHNGGSLGMSDESTWTVDSRGGGATQLKVTSQVMSDSTASASMGSMTVHYALSGTRTSTMDVDDATGWVIRSSSESDISGTADMEGSPMGSMEIPMTVKRLTTIEPGNGG
jgi:Family of unknown function (DUF6263)